MIFTEPIKPPNRPKRELEMTRAVQVCIRLHNVTSMM